MQTCQCVQKKLICLRDVNDTAAYRDVVACAGPSAGSEWACSEEHTGDHRIVLGFMNHSGTNPNFCAISGPLDHFVLSCLTMSQVCSSVHHIRVPVDPALGSAAQHRRMTHVKSIFAQCSHTILLICNNSVLYIQLFTGDMKPQMV